MISSLARELPVTIRGDRINVTTPLLIPSFSSKAVHGSDLTKFFEVYIPNIPDSFLISAYDIYHEYLPIPTDQSAEVMFLDSGGYESSKDDEILAPMYPSAEPLKFSLENYESVLSAMPSSFPIIATSFDHPRIRMPIKEQIEAASRTFSQFPSLGREILIKPETDTQTLLRIDLVTSNIAAFSNFDAIGLVEKELGRSTGERMMNIAKVRLAMDHEGLTEPIHIFGSLDPISTLLYFLAGADMFDGLNWIRFAYFRGLTVQHLDRIALEFEPRELDRRGLARNYASNLHYLTELQNRMRRFLLDGDPQRLGAHASFFERTWDDLRSRMKGAL